MYGYYAEMMTKFQKQHDNQSKYKAHLILKSFQTLRSNSQQLEELLHPTHHGHSPPTPSLRTTGLPHS